mmetsp:Transcript_104126/g.304025  ORF Transcript_104126/g.304025 Transcript_104126/m.304025 type:complete len:321 (-) Transcript_104126:48-1010(-)
MASSVGLAALTMHRPLPPGLRLTVLPAVTDLEAAAEELGARISARLGVLEAGISYRHALNRRKLQPALSLRVLPHTRAVLADAMAAFGLPSPPASDSRLSLIARHYHSRQCRLQFHRDSLTLFEEPVFGLVLRGGGAAPRLVFRPPAQQQSAETAPHADDFELPEQPGLALRLMGPARYEWSHGVPPERAAAAASCSGARPRRLSLTWRWLRPSAVRWADASGPEAELWVSRFMSLALGRGFSRAQALAFLGVGGSEASLPAEPAMAEAKEWVAVPWLRAARMEAALLAAENGPQSVGSRAAMALSLLGLWEEAGGGLGG